VAARRLVIVMVVLLGLSTLAAALVQPPERRSETTTTEERRQADDEREGGWTGNAPLAGRVIGARMRISNAPPKVVRVRPGDQVRLSVSGSVGEDIVIPGFGLTETMSPDAPAHFDILIERLGTFAVRALDSGRLAGRIVSCPARPEARPGGSKARACAPGGEPEGSGRARSARRP
jgi:hypothetical protein